MVPQTFNVPTSETKEETLLPVSSQYASMVCRETLSQKTLNRKADDRYIYIERERGHVKNISDFTGSFVTVGFGAMHFFFSFWLHGLLSCC